MKADKKLKSYSRAGFVYDNLMPTQDLLGSIIRDSPKPTHKFTKARLAKGMTTDSFDHLIGDSLGDRWINAWNNGVRNLAVNGVNGKINYTPKTQIHKADRREKLIDLFRNPDYKKKVKSLWTKVITSEKEDDKVSSENKVPSEKGQGSVNFDTKISQEIAQILVEKFLGEIAGIDNRAPGGSGSQIADEVGGRVNADSTFKDVKVLPVKSGIETGGKGSQASKQSDRSGRPGKPGGVWQGKIYNVRPRTRNINLTAASIDVSPYKNQKIELGADPSIENSLNQPQNAKIDSPKTRKVLNLRELLKNLRDQQSITVKNPHSAPTSPNQSTLQLSNLSPTQLFNSNRPPKSSPRSPFQYPKNPSQPSNLSPNPFQLPKQYYPHQPTHFSQQFPPQNNSPCNKF
jgi:hypothetical protein